MPKTFIVSDIKFDTDGKRVKGLPKTLTITVPDESCESDYDIVEYISDEISNITGWCHMGFTTDPPLNE